MGDWKAAHDKLLELYNDLQSQGAATPHNNWEVFTPSPRQRIRWLLRDAVKRI